MSPRRPAIGPERPLTGDFRTPPRGLKVAFHSRFNSVAPGRASAKPAILVMRRLRNRKCEGLADAGAANPFALPRNSLVGVVEVPGVGQQARRQMSLSGTMKITGLSSPRRLRSLHLTGSFADGL